MEILLDAALGMGQPGFLIGIAVEELALEEPCRAVALKSYRSTCTSEAWK